MGHGLYVGIISRHCQRQSNIYWLCFDARFNASQTMFAQDFGESDGSRASGSGNPVVNEKTGNGI